MRVKSNKALRRSACLAGAYASSTVELPPALPLWRGALPRIGAANTIAAAVAGILYGAGGTAMAQEAAPAAASAVAPESLQEVVVTATAFRRAFGRNPPAVRPVPTSRSPASRAAATRPSSPP